MTSDIHTSAGRRLRVLIVAPFVPGFPASGSPARTYCLTEQLVGEFDFALLASTTYGGDERHLDQCRRLFQRCEVNLLEPRTGRRPVSVLNRLKNLVMGPHPTFAQLEEHTASVAPKLAKLVEEWRPDLIQIEESVVFPWLHLLPRRIPVLLNAHNVVYVLTDRLARQHTALRDAVRERIQAWKFKRREIKIFRLVDHVIAVSTQERDLLRQVVPERRLSVVPNGVNTEYFSPQGEGDPLHLVFTGKMDYPPNEDAVMFFAAEVLPILRAQQPQFRLEVVGMGASPTLHAAGQRLGFEVTGAVPDVRPYLARAGIAVVPLRSGAGTRLKILEALSSGLPVVSTSIGAEGLSYEDGTDLLIADQAAHFAAQVLRLSTDEQLRGRLRTTGRAMVEKRYGWAQLAAPIAGIYEALAGARASQI